MDGVVDSRGEGETVGRESVANASEGQSIH